MRRNASLSHAGSFRLFGIITLIAVCLSAGIAVARIRSVASANPLDRSGHTATLLPDGRVLVAGGERNLIAIARAELFDPATKATTSGPLGITGRADHTATLLEDGRVLIAGGRNGQVALESVEFYDPLAGSFAFVGRLAQPRSGHVSVALRSGRVLLAGGDGARTAELFDGRDFTRLDTLTNAPRRAASATLLSDGRVLIIGGRGLDGEPLASAEVFDPVAGTFRTIESMRNARVAPTLVPLPDGKVQVLGGDPEATMEIFTPLGDRFTAFTILRALDENVLAKTPARFATGPSSKVDVAVTLAGIAPADEPSGGTIASNKASSGGGGKTAWITTDKADYAPGQRVTVTGGNFGANETVTLLFERNPETTPATTLYATTDSKGNFTNDEYVCLPTDAYVTFTLKATGQKSGRVAITSFTDAPEVTSVTPSTGPSAGGTTASPTGTVILTGSDFPGSGTVIVKFGGVAATNVHATATTITCTPPARSAAGKVTVSVTVDSGGGGGGGGDTENLSVIEPNEYEYTAPSLSSTSPSFGTTAGGTTVTISGSSFGAAQGNGGVAIGGAACIPSSWSNIQIICNTTARAAGLVNVVVTANGGASGTQTDGYTYVAPPPAPISTNPSSGSTAGGTTVTINGTGFGAAQGTGGVAIGGVTCTPVSWSDSSIACTTGPRTAATVDVVVTANGGASGTQPGGYQYVETADCAGVFPGQVTYATGTFPQSVAIGDLNGDGKPDLAVANYGNNSVSVRLGMGPGTFAAKVDYPTGTEPQSVAIGDLNGDGHPDLAVANRGSHTVSVLLGTGNGSFAARMDYGTQFSPHSVAIGDLNGDGNPDLAVANLGSSSVSVLLGNGIGTFAATTNYGTGLNPISVAIGDLNGDGKPDLAVANSNTSTVTINNISNSVSVLLASPTGFSAAANYPVGGGARSVAIGDLNGDGKPDLAVANHGDGLFSGNRVSVLLGSGSGDGTFPTRADYDTGTTPRSVAIGDLNGDGKPDLAVASLNSQAVSVLRGNGDGTFATRVDYLTGGSDPVFVAIGDLNGDGKLDLAVANQLSHNVSVLLNCPLPVLTIDPVSKVYTAATQTTTVTASVAGVVSDVKYTGTNLTVYSTSVTGPTNVGDYNVTADFTPTDGVNYLSLSDAAAWNNPFQITKATPTFGSFTYANGAEFTYNGSAQGAITATVVGVGAETSLVSASGSLSIGYYGTQFNLTTYGNSVDPIGGVGAATTPPTNGGNYTAYLRYTDTSGNYENAFATRTFNIVRATPVARLFSSATNAQSNIQYNYYDQTAHTIAQGNVAGIMAGTTRVTGLGGATDVLASGPTGEVTDWYRGASDDSCVSGLVTWRSTAHPDSSPPGAAGTYIVAVDYNPTADSLNWNNYNSLDHTASCTTTDCAPATGPKAGNFTINGTPHTITGTFTTNAPYDGQTQLGAADITVAARHVYESPSALAGQKTGRTLRWQTYDATLGDPGFNTLSSSPYCIIQGAPLLDPVTGTTTAKIRFIHANSSAAQCTIRAWYSDGCDFGGTVSVAQAVRILPAQIHIQWPVPDPITSSTALTQGTGTLGAPSSLPPQLDAVAYWINTQTGTPVNTVVQPGNPFVAPASSYFYGGHPSCGACTYTYSYYPTAGSLLPAGNNQDLSLVFSTTSPDFISPRAVNQFINVTADAFDNTVWYCDTYHYVTRPARSLPVNLTSGSSVVTSAAGFLPVDVGATIAASGILSGTKIVSVDSDSQVTISNNATATAANRSATITPPALKVLGSDGPMRGMVSGDFNGDGRKDLIVANKLSLAFYEGFGDGTFKLPVEIHKPVGADLYEMVAGDFDGAGGLDFAVADAANGKVYVFLNYSGGAVGPSQTLDTGALSSPRALAVGNMDGVLRADLIVSNNGTDSVMIFTNNGSGSFALSDTYALSVGDKPWGVVTGEFTGDAALDVMVALNGTTNSVAIISGNGTGGFEPFSKVNRNVNGPYPRSLAAADLDGDTRTDVLVGNYGNPATTPTGTIYKMMNTGGGNFSIALAAAVVRPSMIVIADILADGVPRDFGVVSQSANALFLFGGNSTGAGNYTATAFKNNTSGVRATGTSPYALVIDDFDGDNRLDIVTNGTTDLKVFAANEVPVANTQSVKVGAATYHPNFPTPIYTGGETATITVELDGTGPFVVKWNDGTSQSTSLKTLVRNVKPAVPTEYSITSVTGASGCAGSGISTTVKLDPAAPPSS
jgi:hypothetical protein